MLAIDAHQHFWKYSPVKDAWITDDMKVIQRDFLPQDLAPILATHGIEGCVAVQADQSEAETEFLLSLAEEHAFIKGVVGWVDLRADNLSERLAYFSKFKKLKGFRHIIQGEPSGFMLDRKFILGVQKLAEYNFTYDLLLYHHQLPEALQFIHQLPQANIVVDHLAKPSIRTQEKNEWALNIAALAAFKNVHCKISGMVTEADWKNWKQNDFTPYLDVLFESFGSARLMYGSDWPVCLLAASYEAQLSIAQTYLSTFSSHEKHLVMGENARKFYNL
ncbi:amidohydrolase family protein [Ohtaekwangia koreensis]|uniref:L-fuconolactonase n=1 Tax=Ohtaekwangia koreensis TaxID=688867 RepID=A0A1T5MF13_9BACT|nr:amidohydrolase family protein [Ohtaekwangia koreensis]SKC86810.1 L-fuconolactonase [Ohtaekwangia koreensis]